MFSPASKLGLPCHANFILQHHSLVSKRAAKTADTLALSSTEGEGVMPPPP